MKTIFIALLFVTPILASAHTFARYECDILANDTAWFAKLRDQKIDRAIVLRDVAKVLRENKSESYITDDEDVDTILAIINVLYDTPDLTPSAAGDKAKNVCINELKNSV